MMRIRNILFPILRRLPVAPAASKVRYRVVMKYLGSVLVVLGGSLALAAAAAFLLGEGAGNVAAYVVPAAASVAAGVYLYRNSPERDVNVPEAAAVASLSFLAASAVGAVPFVAIPGLPVLDAWFEAMSGFTTTGFTLVDVEQAPGSILFFRALAQWLGGMGFLLITVSLLLVSGRSAVTFFKEEAEEKLFPRIGRHLRLIIKTYAILTACGIVALYATGTGIFGAVCYTLAGISTGGFAVHAGSVGELPRFAAAFAFMPLMLLGSISFVLYYRTWKTSHGWRSMFRVFSRDSQVRWLVALVIVLGVLLSLAIGGEGRFFHGFFLAVSAQTTTGFSTLDTSALPPAALLLVAGAMFIGGSMGSTSGGIKLFRLGASVRSFNKFMLVQQYPEETVLPGGVGGTSERTFTREELPGIFFIIAVYAAAVFLATVVFVYAGHDPLASLFEVTSAVGTVGLSSGVVGPELNPGLKVFLVFLMWAGRLEFLPILVWLYSLAMTQR